MIKVTVTTVVSSEAYETGILEQKNKQNKII